MSTAPPSRPSGLTPRPGVGRAFPGSRRVRLGDVSPRGRLRLDAATRYLQDLSTDDTTDAALEGAEAWVVRKTVLEVLAFPRYQEHLDLVTWCSGTGSHVAERRISMRGDSGGHLETATTWVHVDPASGRPKRVPPAFHDLYGPAAGERRIKARLEHPEPTDGAEVVPWLLRFTDFDVLAHVNNAAYWEPVEEALAARPALRAPLSAEVEHRRAVERGAQVDVLVADDGPALHVWVVADGMVAATALVRPMR